MVQKRKANKKNHEVSKLEKNINVFGHQKKNERNKLNHTIKDQEKYNSYPMLVGMDDRNLNLTKLK